MDFFDSFIVSESKIGVYIQKVVMNSYDEASEGEIQLMFSEKFIRVSGNDQKGEKQKEVDKKGGW